MGDTKTEDRADNTVTNKSDPALRIAHEDQQDWSFELAHFDDGRMEKP